MGLGSLVYSHLEGLTLSVETLGVFFKTKNRSISVTKVNKEPGGLCSNDHLVAEGQRLQARLYPPPSRSDGRITCLHVHCFEGRIGWEKLM